MLCRFRTSSGSRETRIEEFINDLLVILSSRTDAGRAAAEGKPFAVEVITDPDVPITDHPPQPLPPSSVDADFSEHGGFNGDFFRNSGDGSECTL